MKFEVVHTTRYRYSQPVTSCHNESHLRPRSFERQILEHSQYVIEPLPASLYERTDYFGNPVAYFCVEQPHNVLSVTARSLVELFPVVTPELQRSTPWDDIRARRLDDPSLSTIEAREFVLDSPLISADATLAAFAQPSFPSGRPLLEAVHDLSQRIHREFVYDRNSTTIFTPLADVLALRRGVCQDFAHLAIGCVRAMGLPARYVSGYLESVPPPGQERLQGADASHAWFAVFDPDGWVDFDPTNNQIAPGAYVTTAWGRDYADVTPLKGVVFGGGSHTLDVSVEIVRTGTD